MTTEDRETLCRLLTELINWQDTVTHHNEMGPSHEHQTRSAIADRNSARNRILAFCDARIGEVKDE